jgi:hypothetical protein
MEDLGTGWQAGIEHMRIGTREVRRIHARSRQGSRARGFVQRLFNDARGVIHSSLGRSAAEPQAGMAGAVGAGRLGVENSFRVVPGSFYGRW